MIISIIGLGLIGGSLAYSLKDFNNADIIGADLCPATREKALRSGAVSRVFANADDSVKDADLVILSLHPDRAAGVIKGAAFKQGAVVTDVCGVKQNLPLRALLPEYVDYVPCHPMAGKEAGGFDNAGDELFIGAGFIITPTENSKPESINLIESMARYIGAGEIVCCSPGKHDEYVAYTSHLCHLSAAAICMAYPDGLSRAFMGGSFRDCTRVANIDAGLWSSLLLENRQNVLRELTRYQANLEELKNAVESGDHAVLGGLLEQAGTNKRGFK